MRTFFFSVSKSEVLHRYSAEIRLMSGFMELCWPSPTWGEYGDGLCVCVWGGGEEVNGM